MLSLVTLKKISEYFLGGFAEMFIIIDFFLVVYILSRVFMIPLVCQGFKRDLF